MALDAREAPRRRDRAATPGSACGPGIVSQERAGDVVERLLQPAMFSGWGIRTYASGQPGYNPIGYHTGTVWPHDTSLIAAGLQAVWLRRGVEPAGRADDGGGAAIPGLPAARSCSAASTRAMPACPCRIRSRARRRRGPPARRSCSSRRCSGCGRTRNGGELELIHPHLPDWLGKVTLIDLRVGDASVDLLFHRWRGTTSAEVLRKVGDVAVTIRL